MLIKWNGLGPLAVGDPRQGSNYKLAAVIVCTPGVNELPDDVWARLKQNPQVASLVEKGKDGGLEVVSEGVKDADRKRAEEKGEAVALSGFKPDQAVALIKQTYNRELLEQWADADNRPKVRRAIEAQLKELVVEPTKKEA